ncbi:MAG: hypothetical protein RR288_03865 [Oscillibacter sp.]
MQQSSFLRRVLRAVFGLLFFAVGVFLMVQANIGLAPWDVFSMGLSYHLPLSYGQSMVTISLSIVLLDVLLKEEIGLGTILDAVLVGSAVDVYTSFGLVPKCETLLGGLAMMTAGLFIMGIGQVIYMGAALSCGPRDALLVALGRRMRKIPIGGVQILLQACALTIGWLLGGPVGVGTVVAVFGIGITMQLVFRVLKFEPRDLVQEGIGQSLRRIGTLASAKKTADAAGENSAAGQAENRKD